MIPYLDRSRKHVEDLRKKHSELRALTEVEHENNALAMYRIWQFYYVPNTEENATEWIENSTTNGEIGVNYAKKVRSQLK
jgi:hypothetical protein